jgi:ferrous iron transport protein B
MSAGSFSAGKTFSIDYGRDIEAEITHLQDLIEHTPAARSIYPARWLAINLLEGDASLRTRLAVLAGGKRLLDEAQASIQQLERIFGDEAEIIIPDYRYGWINGLVRQAVTRPEEQDLTPSDRIDRIVTNRLLGIPIFLLAMWAVFMLTSEVSAPYLDWIESLGTGPITNWATYILGMLGLSGSWVESLIVDGIITGVGGVLVFIPVLTFLYFSLTMLEDSGYMARAAFVMDRLMQVIGLHGKSFLPMLVGFGCTVPAFYATRTLENEKDRVLTGLLVPFMSCGARLPVYVLFAAVFFPRSAGTVVFGLYLLGIAVAVILGLVLKNTLFKGKEKSTFVMELPPYRMPNFRGVWLHTWERTGAFIKNAWTLIMAVSIILWFLLAIPAPGGEGAFAETDVDNSLFATASGVVAPVLEPLGFGTWEAAGSLMTGFVAKEVVVSTMAQIYGVDGKSAQGMEKSTFLEDLQFIILGFIQATIDTLKSIPLIFGIDLLEEGDSEVGSSALMRSVHASFQASSGGYGALAGLAFMVFVLIYTPCMAAIAAERQELGTKWMWVSIIGQLVLAWLLALVVFQGGKALGWG